MARDPASSAPHPCVPNVIVPKAIGLTTRPERPNVR